MAWAMGAVWGGPPRDPLATLTPGVGPRPAAADRLDRLHREERVEKRRLLLVVLFFGVAGFTLLYSRG